jgi:hypothetical protein
VVITSFGYFKCFGVLFGVLTQTWWKKKQVSKNSLSPNASAT